MPAPETGAPTAHDILGDAMFNSKITSVIVVGFEADGALVVLHSWDHPVLLAGMLEAAKLQILCPSFTDTDPNEDAED